MGIAPMIRASTAKELAMKFASFFLTEGNYQASTGAMYSESAAQALPAVSAKEIPASNEMYGYAGLAVQSVGYEEGVDAPAVHVYLTKGSVRQKKSLSVDADGISIRIHRMGPIKVRPDAAAVTTHHGNIFIYKNRVACGSSCAPSGESYSGTFGALLRKGRSKQLYGLSSNHVFAACNHTPIAMPILAPSNMDGRPGERALGEICIHDSIIELRSGVPALVEPCTHDAAIAKVTNSDEVTSWQGNAANGFDTPSPTVNPAAGMEVKKTGRTTGLTFGTIEALINTPTPIPYQADHFRATVWFQNVWTIRAKSGAFALPGDSGSLIALADESGSVGLLFAASRDGSYAWMCAIGDTLAAFGPDFTLASGHGV